MAKEWYPCGLHGLLPLRFIPRDFRINHIYVFNINELGPAFFLEGNFNCSGHVDAQEPIVILSFARARLREHEVSLAFFVADLQHAK